MARPQQEIAREMSEHYAALAGLWAEFAAADRPKPREVKSPPAPADAKIVRDVSRRLRRLK